MLSKVDRAALKAVTVILLAMVTTALVSRIIISIQTPPKQRVEQSELAPQASLSVTPEPEVRRAIPVNFPRPQRMPPQEPAGVTVRITPDEWSELITVPAGRVATLQSTLARIRVERNRTELGVFSRTPPARKSSPDDGPFTIRIKPIESWNPAPQTLSFGPETRTLRFLSLGTDSETVYIEFKEVRH